MIYDGMFTVFFLAVTVALKVWLNLSTNLLSNMALVKLGDLNSSPIDNDIGKSIIE